MLSGAGNILPMATGFFRDDGHFLLCVYLCWCICAVYTCRGGVQVCGHEQQLEEDGERPALSPLRWHLSLNLEQGWEPASTSHLHSLS